MRNKKDKSKFLRGILVIFIILFAMAFLAMIFITFGKYISEPHFKITKEECWTESLEVYTMWYSYPYSCMVNIGKSIERLRIEYLYLDCNNKRTRGCSELKKEIDNFRQEAEKECEDDLESMRLRQEQESYREVCEQVEVERLITNQLECDGSNYCWNSSFFPYELRIEWLDENAECILEIDGCIEYKYNDYIIETWDQIK